MGVSIERVGIGDIRMVVDLARSIWFEHYPAIISWSQIHYMLEAGYETSVIAAELERGVQWRTAWVDGVLRGFAAWEVLGNQVKVHKLYVERAARGHGVARHLVNAAADDARRLGANAIYLAVNKRNEIAIRAYLSLGFAFRRAMRADIGHGFAMDDYEMVRPV
jgi:GNAT superfamily N-acetyltransferase